ncbi:polyprenyl synthetase family protein [Streptomyces sp. NPDC052236]|uniref:polyprenyl synthetase family protein n=1 Tax=Streptomyces sp. NPDC052236 TaxID=3365686 RepID=UPI0037D6BDD0
MEPHVDDAAQRPAWLLDEPVFAQLNTLEGVLRDALHCADADLADAALHLVRRGGKRLRPTLLFLAAAAVQEQAAAAPAAVRQCDPFRIKPPKPAATVPTSVPHIAQCSASRQSAPEADLLRMAAAVELLHVASLYHDDVMDRAASRRGGHTANALWGQATAVTAGTFVVARAMRLLSRLDPQLAAWAGDSALALSVGQLQEVENAHYLGHRLESYTRIAARKTAVLFELSCRAGAYLAGAGQAGIDALGRYGRCVGMAFQAADDMLDITSTTAALGKRAGSDLREGVYGLPVLIALSQNSPASRRLRVLLGRSDLSETDVAQAHQLISESGGVIGAGNIAHNYAHQAVAHISELHDSAAKRSLVGLTHYIVLRRH